MRGWMGAAVFSASAGLACAAPPTLMTPPAEAQRWSIVSASATHGQSLWWIDAGGRRLSREHLNLRGLINDLDQSVTLTPDGRIGALSVRGTTPLGDAAETFTLANGRARWVSPVDKGETVVAGPALYAPFGGTFQAAALDFEALLRAPGHRLALLPSGEAHLEPLTTTTVGDGALKKTVSAWEIVGLSSTPIPIWSDDKGRFFALIQGLGLLPAGYEGAYAGLLATQTAAEARRGPAMLKSLLQPAVDVTAFAHVRMFDADAGAFVDDRTVVVRGGKIAAVTAGSVPPPAGARVIDGTGKTLLPGLWDMHQHVANDWAGPFLLALGITSARDPGNDNEATIDRARRRAAGELLAPHVYPSSLIDGKSPYTAQAGTSVASLDEAIAAVRKAKADGFFGVKIYGSFDPAWVAPTAAEAHRLGLHVHGHIPAGMRPWDAVKDGYDEITHINFVIMQAMPDDVVAKSNTKQRFEGVGLHAADVDLAAEPMKSFIADLARRHTVVDPTLVVYEGLLTPEPGDMPAAYAPWHGKLPPADERNFRGQGIAVAPGSTRAHYRASFTKLEALVAALHRAGVPLVAGTDGSGMELTRELELYVDAGLAPAEALRTATIGAARDVGVAASTGSIAVGKDADLVLVEGDPSKRIGDLRQTRLVMLGGRLMDADALRAAAGISGRPN